MVKIISSLRLVAIASIFLFLTGVNKTNAQTKNNKEQKGFAVVELFTSEGCSSCPPADKAVAELLQEHPAGVFVLGFHVDYWNYLGWKDAFSNAAYSQRQQEYATAFSLNSIYTPQVVVNGKSQFTGSDKATLYNKVESELKTKAASKIVLSAKNGEAAKLLINYKTEVDDKTVLCIALVQLQAKSTVTRGENKGKLLEHIDVVRSFKTVSSGTGNISLALPVGVAANQCRVIAFLQQKNSMSITDVAASAIE
ncbi:MAG: DUF1223 domain-containing protein [Chitinophagaceae bacterium]